MKKVNFILPAAAILLAIGSVLASESSKDTLAPKDVTISQEDCTIIGQCTNQGMQACKNSSGVQLYERLTSSSCTVAAVGTFPAPPNP